MRKLYYVIVLLQIFNRIKSQDLKILAGSWQSAGSVVFRNEHDSIVSKDMILPTYTLTINDHIANLCQYSYSLKSDSLIYKECKLKLKEKKKRLLLKDARSVDSTALFSDRDYCYYTERQSLVFDYEILSDTEIVLTEIFLNVNSEWPHEGVYSAEYRLKKIPAISYPLISDFKKRCEERLHGYKNNRLYLTKYDLSRVIKKLKVGGEFEIHTEKSSKISCYRDEATYYVDALDSLGTDSTIRVHINKEIISTHDADGSLLKKTTYNGSYYPSSLFREIKISEISWISYNGPKSQRAHQISKNIGWLSLFSALVVSPLVSINYKKPDFNKQRYFNVAGVSLGAMTISFSIAAMTNYTQYLIGNRYRKNRGWKVIQKPKFTD